MREMQREQFDSEEEFHFAMWCREAQEAGYIQGITYQPPSYNLSPKQTRKELRPGRKKSKAITRHLLQPHSYTADFIVVPNSKMDNIKHGLVYHEHPILGGHTTRYYVIDVKGTFQMFDGARSFSINQKWVYDKLGVFVNKVVPVKFFKKTWVPRDAAFGKSGRRLKKYAGCPLLEEL